MPEFLIQPAPVGATPVDNRFIGVHMPNAPGEYVKAYLYGLMLAAGGAGDLSCLALEEEVLLAAFRHWEAQGLVRLHEGDPLRVEYLPLPDARPEPAPPAAEHRYTQLVERVTQALHGRTLAAADVARVYDWVQVYGLEEEAVELMVAHCARTAGSARLGFAYLETVARSWADAGVRTLEDAKAHVARYLARQTGAAKILKLWNYSNRPTQPELELYEKWTAGWGFAEDAILLAAAQTTGTRSPSFKYLDAMLETFKAKNLLTAPALAAYLAQREQRQADVKAQAELLLRRMGAKRAPAREDRDQVETWLYDWAMPMELLFYAAELSANKNTPFAYMKKLVADWQAAGVATLKAAREAQAQMESARKDTQPNAAKRSGWDFPQRQYSQEELDRLVINSMREFEP